MSPAPSVPEGTLLWLLQQRQQLQQIKASLAVRAIAKKYLSPEPPSGDNTLSEPGPKVIRCSQCGRPMQLLEQLPPQKLTPGAARPMALEALNENNRSG
jgi:hypothetical protein